MVNGLRKSAMSVGGALARVFFFGRMDFSLLISFIEPAVACQNQYLLFTSDSISMCMFLSIVYRALVSGIIVIYVNYLYPFVSLL